jgi:hypothetical protein
MNSKQLLTHHSTALALLLLAVPILSWAEEPGDEEFSSGRSPASAPDRATADRMADAIERIARLEDSSVVVVSRYRQPCRPNRTPRCSEAHARGAIDIRGTDHDRAIRISRRLGSSFLVIVEEVVSDTTQTNTYYRSGERYTHPIGNPRNAPKTADASHTHIQPDTSSTPPQ